MPRPNPNDYKNLIPGPTSNFCQKAAKILIEGPNLFYALVAYLSNSTGTALSDEFKADICGLNCGGGGGGGTAIDTPTVTASDGTFGNKVQITWSASGVAAGIDPVLSYQIFRALASESNPNNAILIGTSTAPITSFDDTTSIPGIQYNYWVRASNGTINSNFGGPDTGYSGTLGGDAGAPDPVIDLRTTKGWSFETGGSVRVVFTPTPGMDRFDVYRHTADTFGSATKIGSDVIPANPPFPTAPIILPASFKNKQINYLGGVQKEEWIYYDVPPTATDRYYYWVVGKNGTVAAAVSNSDNGWIQIGAGETIVSGPPAEFVFETPVTVPAAVTKMKVVLFSMGGGGAGAGPFMGGGGGGGGAVVICDIPVVPGDVVTMWNLDGFGSGGSEGVPAGNGNVPGVADASAVNNGGVGDGVKLEKNGTFILHILQGNGGQYYGAGGPFAAGGAPGEGYMINGFSDPSFVSYRGTEGSNGRNGVAGTGGWAFGFVQKRITPPTAYNGDESGGSGGTPNSADPVSGSGGKRGFPSHGHYCFV